MSLDAHLTEEPALAEPGSAPGERGDGPDGASSPPPPPPARGRGRGRGPGSGGSAGGAPFAARAWRAAWPKLLAVALFVSVWQVVVWTGWRPPYALPGPLTVGTELWETVTADPKFWPAVLTTLRRAAVGFALALLVGTALGIAVARSGVLRAGVGSLITGFQTMPSITWFPLAILLFGADETAIAFVVVLGAAPSIANGIIAGIDHVPPAFVRLGTVLGARGSRLYRHIVLPAAMPSYVGGLSQGWAFAWRSLMAGELLVIIAERPSLGSRLSFSQEFADAPGLIAHMVIILVIGMLADFAFASASRRMRATRGLAVD